MPLSRPLDVKRTFEVTNRAFAHAALPTFGLQVNRIQTQAVFVNHPVNSAVARFADGLPRLLSAADRNPFLKVVERQGTQRIWVTLIDGFVNLFSPVVQTDKALN